MTVADLFYGLWKMAWAWIPVLVIMIGAGIYESRVYRNQK